MEWALGLSKGLRTTDAFCPRPCHAELRSESAGCAAHSPSQGYSSPAGAATLCPERRFQDRALRIVSIEIHDSANPISSFVDLSYKMFKNAQDFVRTT